GSLVQIDDTAINTGNISYERIVSIRKNDYVYWSSPISVFNVNGISPLTNTSYIFKWNPTIGNANGGFGSWVSANGETMVLGKGYIVKGPENFTNTTQNFTATFNNGTPNNGIITIPISRGSYTGTNYNGTNGTVITRFSDNWNLIGNPYPSAIRALDFLNLNTNIEGAVRLWTHSSLPSSAISSPFYGTAASNYNPADYITYNGLGTVSGPVGFNGYIAGGQGFFVLMNDDVAATQNVTFNNSLRSPSYANNQFYRNVQGDENPSLVTSRIWLDIVDNANNSDRTLVGYTQGATADKDRLFDAVTAVGLSMKIYSLLEEDMLTIQGKSYPIDVNDRVALGVNITSNGNYSIAIAAIDGVASDLPIYLEDKTLNIIHDLRQAPYSFAATSGEFNDRFVLRYNNETLSNDYFVTNNEVMVISNDNIQVVSNATTISDVRIYNVLGQLLLEVNSIESNTFETSKLQKNNEALIIQVTLENGAKVNKKIVF
ncbi:MAG: T9SS sorting signal type C domain-containing protein, partial [Bacteroidia bacterium]